MNKIFKVRWTSEIKYRMSVFAEDQDEAEDIIYAGDFNIADADITDEDIISVEVSLDN